MTMPIVLKNLKRYYTAIPHGFSVGNVFIDTRGVSHYFSDDEFHRYREHAAVVYDFKGSGAMMPGFIETHVHGAADYNFSMDYHAADAVAEMQKALIALGKTGVTYVMPTLVTLDIDNLKQCLLMINQYVQAEKQQASTGAALVVGVHLEGPFISASCKGSHDEDILKKIQQKGISLALFLEIVSTAPDIDHWKITIDPALPNMIAFLQAVKKGIQRADGSPIYVYPFIGHCNPSTTILEAAINTGAIRGFTHLGNAMGESAQRIHETVLEQYITSNVVKLALSCASNSDHPLFAELIVDDFHLSATFIKYVANRLGASQIFLVTDALGYTADGRHQLGRTPIIKKGNAFWIADAYDHNIASSVLAGSAASYEQVVHRYFRLMHQNFEAVLLASHINARHMLGNPESIAHHDRRNYVIFDEHSNMILSACQGNLYFHIEFDEKIFSESEMNFRN